MCQSYLCYALPMTLSCCSTLYRFTVLSADRASIASDNAYMVHAMICPRIPVLWVQGVNWLWSTHSFAAEAVLSSWEKAWEQVWMMCIQCIHPRKLEPHFWDAMHATAGALSHANTWQPCWIKYFTLYKTGARRYLIHCPKQVR